MSERTRLGLATKAVLGVAIALALGVLALTQASAGGGATVSIGRLTIADGESGDVSLNSLDVPSPGLGAWEIGVLYDPSVVSVAGCVEESGSVCNPDFGPGQVRIAGASASGYVGDRTLAVLSFRCEDEGATSLTLVVDVFSNAIPGNPQPITHSVDHGGVTCTQAEGGPEPTRRPTARPTSGPTEPPTQPTTAAGATATPSGGVTGLPPTGSGGSDGGAGFTWIALAVAGLGLAATGAAGARRLLANRS